MLSLEQGFYLLTLDRVPLMASAAHHSEEHLAEIGLEGLATRSGTRGSVDRLVLTERSTQRTFEVDVDLQPGDSHRFTELFTGFYDLEVFWESGATPDTFMDIFVNNGQTTVQPVSN